MPPGDGKLKPEDEIILAVVLSIVGFAIISFTFYKIRTHTRRLNAQQRREQEDLERNGSPPGPGGGGGSLGSGGVREKKRSFGGEGDGSLEKGWTAGNIPPRLSTTSATDNRSRRSGLSDSGSDKGGARRLYVEHKAELEGDMTAPDEIDGKGLSAAKNKFELEGSGPPAELSGEPMRFSWGGAGTGTTGSTGTMSSTATSGTYGSMAMSSSAVSDATTLFRYSHRPSYALRTPIEDMAEEEERDMGTLSPEGHSRFTELHLGSSPSALGYRDGEVSPMSPAPRSIRTFSLDGTVVEAQMSGNSDRFTEGAASNSAPASVSMTGGQAITRIEPAVLRKDKWKVWRALGEERRKH